MAWAGRIVVALESMGIPVASLFVLCVLCAAVGGASLLSAWLMRSVVVEVRGTNRRLDVLAGLMTDAGAYGRDALAAAERAAVAAEAAQIASAVGASYLRELRDHAARMLIDSGKPGRHTPSGPRPAVRASQPDLGEIEPPPTVASRPR